MSLTRKLLKGMALTEEQIDTIIDAHTDTVDSLKDQIKELKESAGDTEKLQSELDKVTAELETEKKSSWKVKYDDLKEEYDTYKETQTKKETHAAKESAYRDLLKSVGISDKRISAVLKVSDIDSIELDESGALKDADSLTEAIKDEWGEFITITKPEGATTPTPPTNNGGTNVMTKEDIVKIKDPVARRKAIAENLSTLKGETNNG